MKLVKMVRDVPTKGGVTSLNVQECDVAELKRKGWVIAEENGKQESEIKIPVPENKPEQKGETPKTSVKTKQKTLREE